MFSARKFKFDGSSVLVGLHLNFFELLIHSGNATFAYVSLLQCDTLHELIHAVFHSLFLFTIIITHN